MQFTRIFTKVFRRIFSHRLSVLRFRWKAVFFKGSERGFLFQCFLLFLFAALRRIPGKTVTCFFFLLAASGPVGGGEIHVFLPPSCFSPSPRLAGSARTHARSRRSSKCPLITLSRPPRPSPRQLESEKHISYFRFRTPGMRLQNMPYRRVVELTRKENENEKGMACCCRWGLFVEGVHFELQFNF